MSVQVEIWIDWATCLYSQASADNLDKIRNSQKYFCIICNLLLVWRISSNYLFPVWCDNFACGDIKIIGFLDNLFVLSHLLSIEHGNLLLGKVLKTLGDIQYIITMAMIILKWEFLFFGLFFLATAAFNINEYPKIWQMNKLFSDKLTYGHMLDHSLIQSQQTKKLTRKTESVPELHKYIRNEIDLNWNSTVYINTAGLHVHLHEVQTANYVSACSSCSSCRAGCSPPSAWWGHATQQPGGGITLCYRYTIELETNLREDFTMMEKAPSRTLS